MAKQGREFEEAVWHLARALNQPAEVLFDHMIPDKDTGLPRQCDVWINTKVAGHWSLSILVSCKDHKRKLHQGDIGAFHDEVRSTGASTGVIYSRRGFTAPALKKVKVLGLSCCRLYQNEPADIPEIFWFDNYACDPTVKLQLVENKSGENFELWNDLFAFEFSEGETILQSVIRAFHELEEKLVKNVAQTLDFPQYGIASIEYVSEDKEPLITLQIAIHWRKYRSRVGATLVNGSYCLTNGSFVGTLSGPTIAVKEVHPGENWEEISDPSYHFPKQKQFWIRYKGDFEKALQERLGPQIIPSS